MQEPHRGKKRDLPGARGRCRDHARRPGGLKGSGSRSQGRAGGKHIVEQQDPRALNGKDRHQRGPGIPGPAATAQAPLVVQGIAGQCIFQRQAQLPCRDAGNLLHVVEPTTGKGLWRAGHEGDGVEIRPEAVPPVAPPPGTQGGDDHLGKQGRSPTLAGILIAAYNPVERPCMNPIAASAIERLKRT